MAAKKKETPEERRARLNKTLDVDLAWLEPSEDAERIEVRAQDGAPLAVPPLSSLRGTTAATATRKETPEERRARLNKTLDVDPAWLEAAPMRPPAKTMEIDPSMIEEVPVPPVPPKARADNSGPPRPPSPKAPPLPARARAKTGDEATVEKKRKSRRPPPMK
jgi:hypothetical protein